MRVLLVGDSIMRGTAGGAPGGCRPALSDGLIADGIAATWVGPYTTENPPGYSACLHGAISGRTAQQLATGSDGFPTLAEMVASFAPDLAGVQIGINDKLAGRTDAQILDDLDGAIAAACSVAPSLTVLIGGPADSAGANLAGVRAALPARLKAQRDAGRSAQYWLGFGGLPITDTFDGLHPNPTGDDLNRKEWQRVMRSIAGPPARWAPL